jgi:GYF domain 2
MSAHSSGWYVRGRTNTADGPLTIKDITQRLKDGSLTGRTVCWREGMSQWLPLHQVQPLASLVRCEQQASPRTAHEVSGAPTDEPSHLQSSRTLIAAVSCSILVLCAMVGAGAWLTWGSFRQVHQADQPAGAAARKAQNGPPQNPRRQRVAKAAAPVKRIAVNDQEPLKASVPKGDVGPRPKAAQKAEPIPVDQPAKEVLRYETIVAQVNDLSVQTGTAIAVAHAHGIGVSRLIRGNEIKAREEQERATEEGNKLFADAHAKFEDYVATLRGKTIEVHGTVEHVGETVTRVLFGGPGQRRGYVAFKPVAPTAPFASWITLNLRADGSSLSVGRDVSEAFAKDLQPGDRLLVKGTISRAEVNYNVLSRRRTGYFPVNVTISLRDIDVQRETTGTSQSAKGTSAATASTESGQWKRGASDPMLKQTSSDGPLSGIWRDKRSGLSLRIEDNGSALDIKLSGRNSLVRQFTANLSRDDKKRDSFGGSAEAKFVRNALAYSRPITAKVNKSGQLELKCPDWPDPYGRAKPKTQTATLIRQGDLPRHDRS